MRAFSLAQRVSGLAWLWTVGSLTWTHAAGTLTGRPWQDMDYGPFLTASIEAPQPGTNIAYKGLAIRLGDAFGGERQEAVVFDTDLLRYSVGWTGNFVALKGVVFDGEHWAYPRIEGEPVFVNDVAPGWDRAQSFADPREYPYGPLPREWAHWQGLYLHGQQVVLAYRVGGTAVRERPGLEVRSGLTAFSRVLNRGPASAPQTMAVAFAPDRRAEFIRAAGRAPAQPGSPAVETLVVLSPRAAHTADADPASARGGLWGAWDFERGAGGRVPDATGQGRDLEGRAAPDDVLAAAVVGAPVAARWRATPAGHLRLELPAAPEATRFTVLLWRGPRAGLGAFAELARHTSPAPDLTPLTQGGPPRWSPPLVTRGRRGADAGAYAIDTLTAPEDNPWRSWLRFGGLDFFADGQRAALCTWNGDVWIVSGVDGDLERLTWQRIATGLFQPLGLKIVRDRIYVLGRDQITRLHDLNGDGEADWYENFNNDGLVSEHFHEFATDLKTDAAGNFYYIKCARHALPASHPHHGTLLKLPPDGSKLEVVARGFRAVNGLGIGPRGEITCVDNQGHWMPGNRINWVEPGGWYGNQWAWNPAGRTNYDEPLCWMHNFVDRSGGTHVWVPTDRWGPLRDQLLTISYGMGRMFLVLHEQVDGVRQGGVTRFPFEFDTGVMRGVFHPGNHQLYTCGLYGWAGNKTQPGGFYRVRYTGQPLHLADAFHVARDGVVLHFTDPLEAESATDPGNYDVQIWNYRWTAEYGSPDVRPDGREGRRPLPVASVTLSADGRSVFLRLPELQPAMQVHVLFRLRGVGGEPVRNFIHGTIHKLGTQSGLDALGAGARARRTETATEPQADAPGLMQTLTPLDANGVPAPGATDVRRVRVAALLVPAAEPPSPFLPAGRFRSTWNGFLKLELNEEVRFHVEGRGAAQVRVHDAVVLETHGDPFPATSSATVALRRGLNRIEVRYERPAAGEAEFRLGWSGAQRPREPVPPLVFVHNASDVALQTAERQREGRRVFANFHCVKCHAPAAAVSAGALPELAAEGPALDGAGSRFQAAWLASWMKDPGAALPGADLTMPACLSEAPEAAAAEALDVTAYLLSLTEPAGQDAPGLGGPGVAFGAGWTPASDLVKAGEAHAARLGCVGCHWLPPDDGKAVGGRRGLAHVRAKWQPARLIEFLRAPAARHAWTRMPDFRLSPEETAALAAWVWAKADPVRTEVVPGEPGDPVRGRERFLLLGCANCHAVAGLPKAGMAGHLETLFGREWQTGCLDEVGGARGKAPRFTFTPEQSAALRAFLRGEPASLWRDAPSEFAERQVAHLRCTACHARDLTTDTWSAVLAQAAGAAPKPTTDDEEEGGTAGSVHLGRPDLTFAGEKLQADWMRRLLAGVLPYKARPESQGRMPAFPAYADGLAAGLARQHGFADAVLARPPAEAARVEIGRRIVQVGEGFGCVACHDVGRQKALAGADTATINFAFVADRLRPTWFWRYVRDPQRFRPGTMMPTFIGEDGTTPIKGVLGGEAEAQFDAIWHYLLSLEPASARAP